MTTYEVVDLGNLRVTASTPVVAGPRGAAGVVTPGLQALHDEAEAARDEAEAARAGAEAVGTTNDAVIAGRVNDPASATRLALTATYAPRQAALSPVARPANPRYRMLTTFQPAHGWSVTGVGATGAADVADFRLGNQSLALAITGAQGTVTKTGLTAMNFTSQNVAFLVKVADVSRLSSFDGVGVYLGTGGFAAFKVFKTLLGRSLDTDYPLRNNEWTWVHVDQSQLVATTGAPDMAAITDLQFRFNLQTSGVDPGVKIGAVALLPKQAAIPAGVVNFAFDDGYASHYTLARPALDKWGFGANFFIIKDAIGTAGKMTLAQLHDLERNHASEVSGHAYTAANHNAGLVSIGAPAAEADLVALKEWLVAEDFTGRDWFAYPLGQENAALAAQVAQYFTLARHVAGQYTVPPLPVPADRVRTLMCTSTVTPATINAEIDRAFTYGHILSMTFHQIVASGATGNDYNVADLQTVIDYCNTKGIPVRTFSEIVRLNNT